MTPAADGDPELLGAVAAWSDLPPAGRAGIVAMLRAAAGRAALGR